MKIAIVLVLALATAASANVFADSCTLADGAVVECHASHLCDFFVGCDPDEGCVFRENNCDDYIDCTEDWCDYNGCQNNPVDGNCDDDDACKIWSCDALDGCSYEPLDCEAQAAHPDMACMTLVGCDFHEGCVFVEKNCDDGIACTEDWCEAESGGICVNNPVDGNCDDDDACKIWSCDAGPNDGSRDTTPRSVEEERAGGCYFEPLDCEAQAAHPDMACMELVRCDFDEGCVFVEKTCDDNIACTVDWCEEGTCMHSAVDDECDDNDVCTYNECVEGEGCAVPVELGCWSDYECDVFVRCDPEEGCIFEENTCDDNQKCTEDWCDWEGCHNDWIDGCVADTTDDDGTSGETYRMISAMTGPAGASPMLGVAGVAAVAAVVAVVAHARRSGNLPQ